MGYEGIASNYNDVDLVDTNIKDGVNIFGITGSYTGSYPITSWTWDTFTDINSSGSGGGNITVYYKLFGGFCVLGYISVPSFGYKGIRPTVNSLQRLATKLGFTNIDSYVTRKTENPSNSSVCGSYWDVSGSYRVLDSKSSQGDDLIYAMFLS